MTTPLTPAERADLRQRAERETRKTSKRVEVEVDRLLALLDEVERLDADQQDWRKGVAFIASCLGDDGTNLSCVRLGEIALELRARLESHD